MSWRSTVSNVDETQLENTVPAPYPANRQRGLAAELLMAAMLGLGDALGHERPSEEIVALAPDLTTGDLPLDFGQLPPLE